jgi:hypothetical protein
MHMYMHMCMSRRHMSRRAARAGLLRLVVVSWKVGWRNIQKALPCL